MTHTRRDKDVTLVTLLGYVHSPKIVSFTVLTYTFKVLSPQTHSKLHTMEKLLFNLISLSTNNRIRKQDVWLHGTTFHNMTSYEEITSS